MYVTLPNGTIEAFRQPERAEPKSLLSPASPVRRVAAGSHVFREGDEASHLFEVQSGILRLTRVLENGRRQVIAFALPGDIVGFPNGDLHHTDCEAIGPCEIIQHRREALENGTGNPETHRRLLTAALREISAMQDHFMMLACKSATERVASFLMAMADRIGIRQGRSATIELQMTRADIADFLGLTIETVSRTITQLRNSGIISMHTAHSITVRDADRLAEVSEAA
jgi:CRP/FNR family transcriptional regulator/CRP/FNR family nitrogen fixation transcriptional regulator